MNNDKVVTHEENHAIKLMKISPELIISLILLILFIYQFPHHTFRWIYGAVLLLSLMQYRFLKERLVKKSTRLLILICCFIVVTLTYTSIRVEQGSNNLPGNYNVYQSNAFQHRLSDFHNDDGNGNKSIDIANAKINQYLTNVQNGVLSSDKNEFISFIEPFVNNAYLAASDDVDVLENASTSPFQYRELECILNSRKAWKFAYYNANKFTKTGNTDYLRSFLSERDSAIDAGSSCIPDIQRSAELLTRYYLITRLIGY